MYVVRNRYRDLIEPHILSDKQRGKEALSERGVSRECSLQLIAIVDIENNDPVCST